MEQDNRGQNDNCLEGMRCPKCGQTDGFNIVCTAAFYVMDDGTEDYSDVSWEENAAASCDATCRWHGTVADLRIDVQGVTP